jgi:hypothetical protein
VCGREAKGQLAVQRLDIEQVATNEFDVARGLQLDRRSHRRPARHPAGIRA